MQYAEAHRRLLEVPYRKLRRVSHEAGDFVICHSFSLQLRNAEGVNKDGRLLRRDYVLPRAPNIISLIIRLAFYPFLFDFDVPELLKGCVAYALHSPAARVSYLKAEITVAQLLSRSDVRVTMRHVRSVEETKRVAVEAIKSEFPNNPQIGHKFAVYFTVGAVQ